SPPGLRPIFLPGEFGERLMRAAADYLADYEFDDGENGHHVPTEEERLLMLDAINGVFGDDTFSGILQTLYPRADSPASPAAEPGKFKRGDRVHKISVSSWRGVVVGEYHTSLTPESYAVESEHEPGSVQIFPAKALALIPKETP